MLQHRRYNQRVILVTAHTHAIRWSLIASLTMACTPLLPRSTSAIELPEADAHLQYAEGAFYLDGATVVGTLGTNIAQSVRKQQHSFGGVMTLAIAPNEDMLTLRTALADATNAGFHTLWLQVTGPDGTLRGVRLSLGTPKKATQSPKQATDKKTPSLHWANPKLIISPKQGFILTAFDDVYGRDARLRIPCDEPSCQDGEYPYIELSRMARRLKLDHPGDRAVLLQTTPDVKIQDFVRSLDALRDDTMTGRHRVDMFTDPILSVSDPTL